jgi:EAL domain-containing protein (putative c-di-GMP-specific phosphodiesterase class I)
MSAAGKLVDAVEGVTASFQPLIDLDSGTCAGLEVLARASNAAHGEGTTGFSWMFRDHNIAPKLTRHMLNVSLKTLANLPAHLTPDLWVNLTKFDLLDAEFAFDLQTLLDTYGLAWERIVAEVHEDVILADRGGQTYHSLQEIRRRGGRVALDDFGMGYAGLTQIRDWPIDVIKIDRSFIQGVDTDPHARVVIQALLMIASSRGIDVVAEGIETEAQAKAIRALGCRYGQGFVFDPALPADQLERHLMAFERAGAYPVLA